eukprot:gene34157-biopygen16791
MLLTAGLSAYAFVDSSLRTKLAYRATPLIYVGHDDRSTAYLLYGPARGKLSCWISQYNYVLPDADEVTGVVKLKMQSNNRSGKLVDVSDISVCFGVQHVAMPAAVQAKWLPHGVTAPKNWPQLLNAPDTVEWKEECALIDVKRAIVPVENLPADPQEPTPDRPYANLVMELMWLVRYLKGTVSDECLTFQCSSPASHTAELVLTGYSDADHAADKVTRRSVTGSLVRLNGNTVMFSSKLQKTVARTKTRLVIHLAEEMIRCWKGLEVLV